MAFKVAVVGATGVVGHEILSILAERAFPVSEACAVASERSAKAVERLVERRLDRSHGATTDLGDLLQGEVLVVPERDDRATSMDCWRLPLRTSPQILCGDGRCGYLAQASGAAS